MSLVSLCNEEISKNAKKLTKIVTIDKRNKSSYLLNNLANFDKIFSKNEIYGNIKRHKKPWLHPFSRKQIFGKSTGRKRVKLTPSLQLF